MSLAFHELTSEGEFGELRRLAHAIWRDYYPPIIGAAQTEYMLKTGYSLDALRKDAAAGVTYERIVNSHLDTNADIGFLAYGPHAPGVFKLHKLYMLPAARGRGLGQEALSHVVQRCLDRGASELILAVNKNNTAAIRAYERAGLLRRASVVVDIGGGFVMDDYVYGKALR